MSAPRKKTRPLSPQMEIARKRIAELRKNGGDNLTTIRAEAQDLAHDDNVIAWFLAEDARVLDPDDDDD